MLSVLACGAAGAGAADDAPLLFGFTAAKSRDQQALERRFDAVLNPADLRSWLEKQTAEANNVGSPHDKANAEFVRDQFKQWGWDAKIEVFLALYPTLKQHALELVAPTKFVAALNEPAVDGDATSTRSDGIPPYNVYGADGDVTGELVYVNFGMPEDYKSLARYGIDVRGKIAIARYGGGWRGLKAKLAMAPRRNWLCDLFRPTTGWLRCGGCLAQGQLASRRRRAARLCVGYAGLSRRSADTRRGCNQGCEAAADDRSKNASENSGPADFLRRRHAAAGGPDRTGGAATVAWFAAYHIPPGSRRRESAPAGQF